MAAVQALSDIRTVEAILGRRAGWGRVVRRKRHLSLFLGGAAVLAVACGAVHTSARTQPPRVHVSAHHCRPGRCADPDRRA